MDLSKSGTAANRSHVSGVVTIDNIIHDGEAVKAKVKDDKENANKDEVQQALGVQEYKYSASPDCSWICRLRH
jgi:predicted O-methyltransferase YrrM